MDKLKIALYWGASCGGCEIAVLDINEKIFDLTKIADIVFWPVAIDVKYKDVEAMPDKSIDVCLFNGSVRNEENEHLAKLLRAKSKVLVAFGSCAHEGCIPGLANLANRKELFERAYLESPSTDNPSSVVPKTSVQVKEGTLTLPETFDTVHTLDQVVDVDYYMPGCPPPPAYIWKAVEAIAKNQLPPKGSVLLPNRNECDECPRTRTDKRFSKVYRPYEIVPDEVKCLLEQGVICMGIATREGCGAQCMSVNMPCTGCDGPGDNVLEQGAAMMSALTAILGADGKENDASKLIAQIKDPIGTFYMYSLAHSLLRRKRVI